MQEWQCSKRGLHFGAIYLVFKERPFDAAQDSAPEACKHWATRGQTVPLLLEGLARLR